MDKGRGLIVLLVLFVVLIIIFVICIFVSIKKPIVESVDSKAEIFEYKYVKISNNSTVVGILNLENEFRGIGKDGFVTFESGESFFLLSQLEYGKSEYQCTGSCYCENNQERKSVFSLGKRLNYLVSSVSTVVAIKLAGTHFEEECVAHYTDFCPPDDIGSTVDGCEDIFSDFTEEEFQELYEDLYNDIYQVMFARCLDKLVFDPQSEGGNDYGEHTKTYDCVGRCKENPYYHIDEEYKKIFKYTDCDRSLGPDWVHVECQGINEEECRELSRKKYSDFMMSPMCAIHTVIKVGWKKVSLCMVDTETVKCELANEDVPPKRPMSTNFQDGCVLPGKYESDRVKI